jgi:hypothetical protein
VNSSELNDRHSPLVGAGVYLYIVSTADNQPLQHGKIAVLR